MLTPPLVSLAGHGGRSEAPPHAAADAACMTRATYVEASYQPSPISDGTPGLAPCLCAPPRPLPCRPCTYGTPSASDAVARGCPLLLIAGTRSRPVKTGLRPVFGPPVTILATPLHASSAHRPSHAYIFIGPHLSRLFSGPASAPSIIVPTDGSISHFIPSHPDSSHSSILVFISVVPVCLWRHHT